MAKITEFIGSTAGSHNIIAADTNIKGEIYAEEDFRIDGTIDGNISCKGKIIVGVNSTVSGNINCTHIEILGRIAGNIKCTGSVILRVSSETKGEIKTESIQMDSGAKFDGVCSML